MAPLSDSAPKTQSVLTETYGELEILVPEAFSEYSPELLENQKRAIDLGAVLAEDVKTARADYLYLGWVFEQPRHWCWHLNIPPVRREELRATYPTYHFPSLVERKGFIVAGVFAVLTSESWAFRHPRFNKYIGIEWTCFQKYSEESPTHIDSAEQYTGSLLITLHTYRYIRTGTRAHWRLSSVARSRMLLATRSNKVSNIGRQTWNCIDVKTLFRLGGLYD
jgi:hypothetical protein